MHVHGMRIRRSGKIILKRQNQLIARLHVQVRRLASIFCHKTKALLTLRDRAPVFEVNF